MTFKIVLFGLLFHSLVFTSIGQRIEFEHLSDHEGLVGTTVTCMAKGSYGYMWFGTTNGLSRYDGYTFTNYTSDPKNSFSLKENYVHCLMESSGKELFIGYQHNGFSIFNRETETFTHYIHHVSDTNSLIHDYVLSIFNDSKGNIWIGTRGGLDKFDPKSKNFRHYKPFPDNEFTVSSIAEDSEGNLWLYGRGTSICRFNSVKNTYDYVKLTDDVHQTKAFYRGGVMICDSEDNLWIGNELNGLFKYAIPSGISTPYNSFNKKLLSDNIFTIEEDSKHQIWVGTDGEGVYRYQSNNDSFINYRHDPLDKYSLSSNGVYSIYESEPGIMWIGVYAAGINITKRDKRKFQMISTTGKSGERLNQQSVLSLASDRNGKIWIGTDGGGLDLLDPATKKIRSYTVENSPICSNIIKSLLVDRENKLWIGSYGSGMCYVDLSKGSARSFQASKHDSLRTVLSNNVWSLCEEEDGQIWVGLLGLGMQLFNKQSNTFSYYPYDPQAVHKAICDITCLVKDRKNRIWIGGEVAGLGCYDPATKKFTRFHYTNGSPGTLSDNDIGHIFEDHEGTIWIGTIEGGLNKLVDFDKKIFKYYTMRDGLPSNDIKSILEDHHHNLWIGTDKGISQFNRQDEKFTNFDTDDGLLSKEFNYNAALASSDGYLYFGGTQGLNYFHPDSIRYNHKTPNIVFTSLKIFNQEIKPQTQYGHQMYLEKSISMSDEIKLTHRDNVFSIEFAVLDFLSPSKCKYAYKLEGFDPKWIYTTAEQRFATYTNLDPGTYYFKVIASNNDEIWNNKGITLKVIILPPWWESIWFRCLAIAFLLLSVTCFYYMRLKAIRKRNKYLTEEVKKRTEDLRKANEGLKDRNQEVIIQKEEILAQRNILEAKTKELELLNKTKDKFFSIIGHDLKGPVKALTFLTSMLRKDLDLIKPEGLKDFVMHIDHSSQQVQNLVISLLEWARTQSGQVKIEPEILSAEKVFSDTSHVLYEQLHQKQLELVIRTEPEHTFFGDYNMACTIVRNILSNSIKYSHKGGKIVLSSSVTESQQIRLSIADNGIGMSEKILKQLFSLDKGPSVSGTEKETGTGLGMVISQEFAQLNMGEITAESTADNGSTFHVYLPKAE